MPKPLYNIKEDRVVQNIGSYNFSEREKSVLRKGFNFAVSPKIIPNEKIICGAECAISRFPKEPGDEIQNQIAQIIQNGKLRQSNLNKVEYLNLNELYKNKYITITHAEIGNATDYIEKMESIIKDNAYKLIKRDPNTHLETNNKT